MGTTDINTEISRRVDDLTRRLDRLEADLPPIPARAIGLTRATAHRVNTTATDVANDVGRQLGRFTSTASTALSTTVGQARSAVDRTSSTAQRTTKETIGQARSAVGRTSSTAQRTGRQTVGQARSAVERTSSTARRTSKETIGQARAQAKITGKAARQSATALFDDATRAIEPDGDGKPAAIDDWTKAELYERAQELDIDGRSSMSKVELVRALRSA